MKAMLLAAGRGERMRPLTDRIPKPLLEAGGKPLIVWHIEKLVRAGIRELVINHAHLGAQIEAALGDGSRFGACIQYSHEASALETAGGIANALPLLGDQPFAVVNSDIYCNYDFMHLTERVTTLQASGDAAHLVLVNNPPHHPNGDFALNESRIVPQTPDATTDITTSHLTNPAQDAGQVIGYSHSTRLSKDDSQVAGYPNLPLSGEAHDPPLIRGARGVEMLTFSGIGIYRLSLFKDIPRGSVAPLAPLLRAQIALGKVSGEHYRGFWVDVGTPERLAELDSQICSLQKTSRSQHNAP